jgi:basic membrane protein A and related proteins
MVVRIAAWLAVGVAVCSCASAAGAGPPFRIGYVVQIGSGPQSRDYGGELYRGFIDAARQPGVSGRVVEVGPSGDANPALELLVRERYDVIVAAPSPVMPGVQLVEPVATRHPGTLFLVPDANAAPGPSAPPNVLVTLFRGQEAAYLAGYLAALVADRGKGPHAVSAVGGFQIPQVDTLIAGFRAGARAADPRIRVLIGYSEDFVDPVKCDAVAREQIARGSTVVFDVAGSCGYGALMTAKRRGVWGVGVDADQSLLGPFVLTSVVKHEGFGLEKAIDAIRKHAFPRSGTLVLGYANGGVGLGKISPRVPKELLRRLGRVRAALAAGSIDVPATLK